MLRLAVLMMLSTLIALGTSSDAIAQDGARATVLGTWEGKATFGGSSPAVLTFSSSAGILAWTYSFRYDSVLWGDAAGTVASFTPPSLALTGAWTKHAVPGAVGTGVKFTLTVNGDQMEGTVIADMNNESVALSLTRKK